MKMNKKTTPPKNPAPMVALILSVVLVIGLIAAVIIDTAPDPSVRAKNVYSVSDAKASAAADTVVATVGDMELTNGLLQVFYWETVRTYMATYGSYLDLFYDMSRPLNEIIYDQETGLTMEQYFLELVVGNWEQYARLCQDAQQNGVTPDAALAAELEGLADSLELGKFSTAEDLIRDAYGPAATYDDFAQYMYLYRFGNAYYHSLYDNAVWTEAELEQYYQANEGTLRSNGYGKTDGMIADVRHIMLYVDGNSQEAWDACYDKANSIINEWLAGEATSESFGELANRYSADDDSNTTGGLYSEVKNRDDYPGEFLDWSLDVNRKPGDYEIVATSYSLHIMYCVSTEEAWLKGTKANLTAQWLADKMAAMEQECPLEIDYNKVVLGQGNLNLG